MRRFITGFFACIAIVLMGVVPVHAASNFEKEVQYNLSDYYEDGGFLFEIDRFMAKDSIMTPGNRFEIDLKIVNDFDHAMVMPLSNTQVYAYAAKSRVSNEEMASVYRDWFLLGFEVTGQPVVNKRGLMSFDEYEIFDESGVDSILSGIMINNQAVVLESGATIKIHISFEFSEDASNITRMMSYALKILFPFDTYTVETKTEEEVLPEETDEPVIEEPKEPQLPEAEEKQTDDQEVEKPKEPQLPETEEKQTDDQEVKKPKLPENKDQDELVDIEEDLSDSDKLVSDEPLPIHSPATGSVKSSDRMTVEVLPQTGVINGLTRSVLLVFAGMGIMAIGKHRRKK